MTKRRIKKPKPKKTEGEKRSAGLPVGVAARYPQELLAAIDAARADKPRQRWLVEAARQRLERDLCATAGAGCTYDRVWRGNRFFSMRCLDGCTEALYDHDRCKSRPVVTDAVREFAQRRAEQQRKEREAVES